MPEHSEYLGKHILVGMTYIDHNDTLVEQIQFHGTITRITEEGIFIDRADGTGEFSLPPDLDSLHPAKAGEYRLRSTGEVVVDPDYLSTWTVTSPPPGKGRKRPVADDPSP